MTAAPRIAELLSIRAAAYQLPVLAVCDLCGMRLQTVIGAKEHRQAHEEGLLPYGTITRYWIDVSKLPAIVIIRWESK